MRYLTWNEYVRLTLSYAVFSRNEDGSWTVEVPVLPGCVTWGETRAEAAVMAENAVQGWLVTALRFGDKIPVIDGNALDHSRRRPILSEHRASVYLASRCSHHRYCRSTSGR
jgi:antitoxin HicB